MHTASYVKGFNHKKKILKLFFCFSQEGKAFEIKENTF